MSHPKLFIEPDELEHLRANEITNKNIIVIDLCKAKQYAQAHIPGAHFVQYMDIVKIDKPAMGLLPDDESFSKLLSKLGIDSNSLIVAYDDEGGGCAARFLWTLHVFGHETAVILNGGLHSWANEGHTLDNKATPAPEASTYNISKTHHHTANRAYIQTRLDDDNVRFLDARALVEYNGEKKFSNKSGHIPGAIHYEWTTSMDQSNNLRRLPAETIQKQLNDLDLTADKEIICYCQSHHRSAYSWLVLKSLGYENVKGYPGSWSDWGNQADTPVEI